ncbi:MAG: hypothetical protein JW878_05345 [Methanomicrobia archaeon]|nr:hypothetical protein [Methanomicrobia archaeon]
MSEDKEICFVIMPISKTTTKHTKAYWTRHFKDFLKPLIEENSSLEARRSKPLRGGVLSEIITALVTSPVVVADITDQNPNVFWELGVRQSFKHGTVMIAEEGTKLPFDVGGKGTLFYSNDRLKNEDFRRDFKEALADCLSNPERPDSQVLETMSGRGTLFEIFSRDEAIRRLDAVLAECDWNIEVFDDVIKRAKANQKNPEKRRYVTKRFRFSAIELLVTNRYIDEVQRFFKSAESVLDSCLAVNEMLNSWSYKPNGVEKWFLKKDVQKWKEIISRFRDTVEQARENLSQRF